MSVSQTKAGNQEFKCLNVQGLTAKKDGEKERPQSLLFYLVSFILFNRFHLHFSVWKLRRRERDVDVEVVQLSDPEHRWRGGRRSVRLCGHPDGGRRPGQRVAALSASGGQLGHQPELVAGVGHEAEHADLLPLAAVNKVGRVGVEPGNKLKLLFLNFKYSLW